MVDADGPVAGMAQHPRRAAEIRPKEYSDCARSTATPDSKPHTAKAVAVGDPSYRTVKGIRVAGAETDPEPETGDAGASAFLHGPEDSFHRRPHTDPGEVHDGQGYAGAEAADR